jgi:hypothetical protein
METIEIQEETGNENNQVKTLPITQSAVKNKADDTNNSSVDFFSTL